MPDVDTVERIWAVTLVVYAVVLVVVAVLLAVILRAARDIRRGVADIWTVGQQVANNTIHIALLDTTLHTAGDIHAAAAGIVGASGALKAHAERCPQCPACALGPEAAR
jgi:hypothetical protein